MSAARGERGEALPGAEARELPCPQGAAAHTHGPAQPLSAAPDASGGAVPGRTRGHGLGRADHGPSEQFPFPADPSTGVGARCPSNREKQKTRSIRKGLMKIPWVAQ